MSPMNYPIMFWVKGFTDDIEPKAITKRRTQLLALSEVLTARCQYFKLTNILD